MRKHGHDAPVAVGFGADALEQSAVPARDPRPREFDPSEANDTAVFQRYAGLVAARTVAVPMVTKRQLVGCACAPARSQRGESERGTTKMTDSGHGRPQRVTRRSETPQCGRTAA